MALPGGHGAALRGRPAYRDHGAVARRDGGRQRPALVGEVRRSEGDGGDAQRRRPGVANAVLHVLVQRTVEETVVQRRVDGGDNGVRGRHETQDPARGRRTRRPAAGVARGAAAEGEAGQVVLQRLRGQRRGRSRLSRTSITAPIRGTDDPEYQMPHRSNWRGEGQHITSSFRYEAKAFA